jgi:hypothetical protein
MSSRFKSLGFGSKRKSSPQASTTNGIGPSTPPINNSSTSSLPMNNPGQLGRPPSYTYNPGARPASPLPPGQPVHPPPPLNPGAGYTQPSNPAMPTAHQPPGYGGYPPHPPPQHSIPPTVAQYTGRTTELDGAGRSKAQLIVGIDFGTTFSGVAYAFATNTEAREDIITEWPGSGTHTKQKVCWSNLCSFKY